jgi:hypothetical protein
MSSEAAKKPKFLTKIPSRRYPASSLGIYFSQYGAFDVAEEYIGLRHRCRRRWGIWQHGWAHPLENIDPEWIVGTDGRSQRKFTDQNKLWVFRKDQEAFLKQHGITAVRAIGAPIIYAEIDAVRQPGSLLIMPPHGTADTRFPTITKQYFNWVREIVRNFDNVVACIGFRDYERGEWIGEFKQIGVSCISGADISDLNSLRRMAYIFKSFDYMTTPEKGSHVAYAAYFGCKVSVFGPRVLSDEVRLRALVSGEFYRNYPAGIDIAVKLSSARAHEEMFGRMICQPNDAVEMVEWGKVQLGEGERLSPRDLHEELGWNVKNLVINYVNLAKVKARNFLLDNIGGF